MRKELVLIILTFTVFTSNLIAEEFKSKFNFKFNLPDGYQIFNNINLFQVYDHSNKDPILKILTYCKWIKSHCPKHPK